GGADEPPGSREPHGRDARHHVARDRASRPPGLRLATPLEGGRATTRAPAVRGRRAAPRRAVRARSGTRPRAPRQPHRSGAQGCAPWAGAARRGAEAERRPATEAGMMWIVWIVVLLVVAIS